MEKNNPMTISPAAFAAGLYQEHLEELSFLYEQRMTLLDDPQIQWPDIADFEHRLEAHLDALVVGGQQAVDICLKKVQTGDAGERHGALRLLCRRGMPDAIMPLLPSLSKADDDINKAVGDALKFDMSAELVGKLMTLAKEEPAACASIIFNAIGFKRYYPPNGFEDLLSMDLHSTSPEIIWAVGRFRDRSMGSLIRHFLEHSNPALSASSALTLLRLGQPDTLTICLKVDPALAWSSFLLGIGGGPRHLSPLMQQGTSPEALTGMGLLGHVGAVDTLLNALMDEGCRAHAAMALQMITGADLMETTPQTSLSQDPERWRQWWEQNRTKFRDDSRYRFGEVCTPSLLVNQMASETTQRWLRQLAYEELVVRYDADFAFETEMTVADQVRAISMYRSWAADPSNHLEDGKWYFAGRIM
jgi:uncharacterized protein (TIGR02270 family)